MESLNGRTKEAGQVQKGLRHRKKAAFLGHLCLGLAWVPLAGLDYWFRQMSAARCQVDLA